jgi:hypothetical protein
MRTRERDALGVTTFGAVTQDAASGSGIAQPGNVLFTFTRTSTGNYTVNFDARLSPLVLNAQSGQFTRVATATLVSPGVLSVVRVISNTGAGENGGFSFQVVAIDKRT